MRRPIAAALAIALAVPSGGCALTTDAAMIDMIEDATKDPDPPAPPQEDVPETLLEDPDCC